MATTCPKCQSADTYKTPDHTAAHAAHGVHMLHKWPALGVFALIAAAVHALVADAKWVCRRCEHRF